MSLLLAASLQAVTYVVPSDRDLVRNSDAIVIARAVESHTAWNAGGGIQTLTTFTIEDSMKGDLPSTFTVVELGGVLNGRVHFIPGAPRFVDGGRYLLFLHRTPAGTLTTYGLGLGKFDFTRDLTGRELVARGAAEWTVGWNEYGARYVERLRSVPEFLDFVRTVAKSPDAPASENYTVPVSEAISAKAVIKPVPEFSRGDYLWSSHLRWQSGASATFGYCCAPTFQPGFDGPGGASTAAGMWGGTGVVSYSVSGPSTANKGLTAPDGANTVLFNDPNNELAGFGAGVVALGGVTAASGSYSLGGESFTATQEVDVVVAKTTQFPSGISQATFAAVVAHEMGHTLGFRHADGNGDSTSPPPSCSSPLPCSSGYQAIMEHIVGRTSLGQWDNDAANTVYGAGAVCNNPSITSQPQNASITAGNSTQLSVTATGTNVTYQWFANGSPVGGGTGSSINVSPGSTTSYYVVVSACGTSVQSNTVTVTVTCQAPAITSQPQSQSITSGSSTFLTVGVTGSNPTFQWFQGNPPTGSAIAGGTSSSISVSPTTTTTYFVIVSACGTNVTSAGATVTVAPCTAPSITAQPQSTSVLAGQSTTLSVSASGTNLTFQWYIGSTGNTSQPVFGANQRTLTVTPTGPTSYWVRVSSGCGGAPADSATATVTIGQPCSVTISSVSANPNPVLAGQSFTLTANASTTSGTLSYTWFRGALNDTSNAIGTSQSITLTETATTNYWVRVQSSCGGTAQTGQVTVNLNTGACGTNPNQMCIDNARYRVSLTAHDPSGKTGQGVANYQSDVFGYFSLPDFSTPSDPQVFVKVLGPLQGPNGSVPWVFYSGLTNLDYTLTVFDTTTSQTFKTYHVAPPTNPFKSIGDFDVFGQTSTQCSDVAITSTQTSAGGSCANTGSALCLLNRFSVTLLAKDNPSRSNNQGPGATVPVNDVFGFFTTPAVSPNPTDIQAFIKMINGSVFNNHFWVFLGGLTDFDLTFTVTDTQTGKQKIYNKPAGSTCGWNDTEAF